MDMAVSRNDGENSPNVQDLKRKILPFTVPSNQLQLESLFGDVIKVYILSSRNVIFIDSDAVCFQLCSLTFLQNHLVLLISGHRENGQALLKVHTAKKKWLIYFI